MDIWIIQNGEKTGPIHDFEIRRKIESGELPATTPAWHDGLDAWKPLVEIDLFHREFDKPPEAPEAPEAPEPSEAPEPDTRPAAPPALPDQPHLVRRFWARWLDLYLFAGIWWLAMWALGRDIGLILNNPWIILLHYVPWFILESVLLHHYATTPGKWLLGIRVVNNDGSQLSLAAATRRSSRVLFIGLGFGWFPLALICQAIAWFTTKRLGRPLWDHAGGHRLETSALDPLRIVAYVFILITALVVQWTVIFPYALNKAAEENPEIRQQWETLKEEFRRAGKP